MLWGPGVGTMEKQKWHREVVSVQRASREYTVSKHVSHFVMKTAVYLSRSIIVGIK